MQVAIAIHTQFRLHPLHGVRIGEASKPGPDTNFTVLVTNPTTVFQKADILSGYTAELLTLAETSATQRAQQIETRALRSQGLNSVWGAPAPPQQKEGSSHSLRGAAVGVSLHSKYPLRPAYQSEFGEWEQAGRFQRGFVQCHQVEIQLCIAYGFPSSVHQSRQRTNELVRYAVQQSQRTTFPTIIAGDFNHPGNTLQEFQKLKAQGWATIHDLYFARKGVPLPPTFKESTSNDMAILSPSLLPFVTDIWIDQNLHLAGHHPLCFTLHLPGTGITTSTWKLPQSWLPLQPDPDDIESAYSTAPWTSHLPNEEGLHPLQTWSVQVEKAVHQALRKQHARDPSKFPMDGLPRAYRGRCQPRSVQRVPQPKSIRPACSGQYQATVDQPTVQLRQHVKQLRRVQSLRYRLLKQQTHPQKHRDSSIQQEWNTILQAPGFHRGFDKWLLRHPELIPVPTRDPDAEYLHDVSQLLQLSIDDKTYHIKANAARLAEYKQAQDIKKHGKQQAFGTIKESGTDLIHQIVKKVEFHANVLGTYRYGLLTVSAPQIPPLDLETVVHIHHQSMQIVQASSTHLELVMEDPDVELPPTVTVTQSRPSVAPADIAIELSSFWNQYWQRDTVLEQQELDQWTTFLDLTEHLPIFDQMVVDFQDPDLLQQSLKTMKSKTSRGVCAWAADEIKGLPSSPMRDLCTIFQRHLDQGFPSFLMAAKVVPLEKQPNTDDPSRTRPITITSLIYRFWSRILVRKLLTSWTQWMPPSICGFLPNRGPAAWHYQLQLELEATNLGHTSTSQGGLTLDILKCFNCLPQAPIMALLEHLGMPTQFITARSLSLQRLDRHWPLGNQLFQVGLPTTGCPEGDPLSVAAMVAVNWFMIELLSPIVSRITAFADNWSYVTHHPRDHMPAVKQLVNITGALKLTIDWVKTWGWGTNKSHKAALKAAKQQVTQNQLQLAIAKHARELGYVAHYRLAPFRGPQKVRHAAALRRLRKLRNTNLPMMTKAQVAYSSCIVKSLWGTHLYGCGQIYFQQLRTSLAHALLGAHGNIQPHLAAMTLARGIVDPEFYTIVEAIKQARSFLHQATDEQKQLFFKIASRPLQRAQHAVGPASALGIYLAKLAWSLDRQGNLHTFAFRNLHLQHSNFHGILHTAEYAWMQHLSIQVTNRKDMRHLPVIDRQATLRAIEKQPDTMHVTLGLQITNGFMFAHQKAKFAEHVEPVCPLCDQPDGHRHQMLDCPALSSVRLPYFHTCEALEEHDPIHLAVPVHYLDPYTDAACSHPSAASGRLVSYAIVMLRYQLPHFLDDHPPQERQVDEVCHTLGLAHVTGTQSVPRGEFFAAIKAHELRTEAILVTDSAYVVRCHEWVKAEPQLHRLHFKRNFDLISRLHHLHWNENLQLPVEKIKSHQDWPQRNASHFDDVLGNWAADQVAKKAIVSLATPLTRQFAASAQNATDAASLLQSQYELRQRLSLARVRLLKPEVEASTLDIRYQQLVDWTVDHPWTFPLPLDEEDICLASKYGKVYTSLLLRWLTTLEWPQSPPLTNSVGITWVELAVNFLLLTQHSIPVNMSTHGEADHRCREEVPSIDPGAYSFTNHTNAFCNSIGHVGFLADADLYPAMTTKHVKSLSILQSGVFKKGLPARPKMKLQEQTLNLVQSYCLAHQQQGKTRFEAMPAIPNQSPLISTPFSPPEDDTLRARLSRYHQRRQALRKKRNAEADVS